MLTNHRRALWFSGALLGGLLFMLVAVGRHPTAAAPVTTIPFVGSFDVSMHRWMDDIRTALLTDLFRVMSVLGGGLVTIPLRIVVTVFLFVRRRWVALVVFTLTWVTSEVALAGLKAFFHRGRPPDPLVDVVGYSFPSGHAVAGAAVAVALVLVVLPPGPRRRKWELAAIGYAFVMAFSRVYLSAHWFSDVVAGVLLGAGLAVGCAALVIEITNALTHRGVISRPGVPPSDPVDPTIA